jgi:hypothetical protein
VVPRAWTLYFAEMCGVELADELPESWIESVEFELRGQVPITFSEPAPSVDELDTETEGTIELVRRTCFPFFGLAP